MEWFGHNHPNHNRTVQMTEKKKEFNVFSCRYCAFSYSCVVLHFISEHSFEIISFQAKIIFLYFVLNTDAVLLLLHRIRCLAVSEGKKKGGFANTLRKRFGRSKSKQRSLSADRAGALGRGGGAAEGLHVPGEPPYPAPKTTGQSGPEFQVSHDQAFVKSDIFSYVGSFFQGKPMVPE